MANDMIRNRYQIDEIQQRIGSEQGEFYEGYVPWSEDLNGWRPSAREHFPEGQDRSLTRTIWDSIQEPDARLLIDVVECGSTPDAVEALADLLETNQLEQLPAGPQGLGLVSFQHPEFAPPAIFFVKGNLVFTVTSFGRKAVEVMQIAQRQTLRLDERPTGVKQSLPLEVEYAGGKPGPEIGLRYRLPVQKTENGFVKFFVSGGGIARRERQLMLLATRRGDLKVEMYLVEPGRDPYAGELTVPIE